MNIWGVLPNYSEAAGIKPGSSKAQAGQEQQGGPSFAQSFGQVARSVNMQIAHGGDAGCLQFNRKKEELPEDPFSFVEAQEEIVEDHISRIKQLLKDLKK